MADVGAPERLTEVHAPQSREGVAAKPRNHNSAAVARLDQTCWPKSTRSAPAEEGRSLLPVPPVGKLGISRPVVGRRHTNGQWDYGAEASRCLGEQAFVYVIG